MSGMTDPDFFQGLRVIESVYLTQQGRPYPVRRGWRERLFTLPWRPLQMTRLVTPTIPYQGGVMVNEHTILMHPAFIKSLREVLK